MILQHLLNEFKLQVLDKLGILNLKVVQKYRYYITRPAKVFTVTVNFVVYNANIKLSLRGNK